MRLQMLVDGHPLRTRLMFGFVTLVTRRRVPDIVRILMYRPEFFGEHQNLLSQAVLRGPSSWSVGQRELFAAYTSRVNHCAF